MITNYTLLEMGRGTRRFMRIHEDSLMGNDRDIWNTKINKSSWHYNFDTETLRDRCLLTALLDE